MNLDKYNQLRFARYQRHLCAHGVEGPFNFIEGESEEIADLLERIQKKVFLPDGRTEFLPDKLIEWLKWIEQGGANCYGVFPAISGGAG